MAHTVCIYTWLIWLKLVQVVVLQEVLQVIVLWTTKGSKWSCLLFTLTYVTVQCICSSHSSWLNYLPSQTSHEITVPYSFSYLSSLEMVYLQIRSLAMKCSQLSTIQSYMVVMKSGTLFSFAFTIVIVDTSYNGLSILSQLMQKISFTLLGSITLVRCFLTATSKQPFNIGSGLTPLQSRSYWFNVIVGTYHIY